jgi:flavin reductase (DIM6/NTAB) family NADH-FMN oxidoreductase RutF
LKETGCCVLNFPSNEIYDHCHKTIDNNQYETDEITASGLTAEKSVAVNAPRIAECFLNIECEYLWERQNFENSGNVVVALKAVHICMDDDRYDQSKLGRYGKTGYMYNINAPSNPETGEAGTDGIGIIEFYSGGVSSND